MNKSKNLHQNAKHWMPGGVSSPVRAFGSVGGDPLSMSSGHGTMIRDADGKEYIDFCGSWGPLILGHAHPRVTEALLGRVAKGWTFGTPVEEEGQLAQYLVEGQPAIDLIRFVNSGTEAVMSAIRLARAVTKRDAVLKFSGCYHGHADYLLIKGGSGLATLGQPSSAGVPEDFAKLTMNCPLDDEEKLDQMFDQNGAHLACVILEGVPANNGLLIQRKEWVNHLKHLCEKHGVLLIFDEVLSGFRCPNQMAYKDYGIQPNLITLGKVVGGGMPVGAYGGKREYMEQIAPMGPVYQAGTLSGNPLAMVAGFETLKALDDENGWQKLANLGHFLDGQMAEALATPSDLGYVRHGALFWLYWNSPEPPRTAEGIHTESGKKYAKFFHFMLDSGIYLAPSAYEVGFLNTAMDEQHLSDFVRAVKQAIQKGICS